MRLSPASAEQLPPDVARPAYDRDAQAIGVVHFGLGAFHRAHQAWYTDACMNAGERDWAISGVSLRSDAVARQLEPQDGLYTLTERGEGQTTRLVGSVREALVAGTDRARIVERIGALECRIVSLTVTEKGYCRAGDLPDFALAEASFYPLLAEGLALRRERGLPGVTLLSCDNLPDNGRQLERLMRDWLAFREPDLVEWFEHECACPNSMVDRIVPATTAADLDALEARIGLRDEGAVFAEPFSQWVIEDRFAAPRPGWDRVSVQLVPEVAPYETAKLRMLNGAHSALAYCGLERGHAFVHEAIADAELRPLVEQLMRVEGASSFRPADGQDLEAYADSLLARFANPALGHRLDQIAMDGSEKIPQRWLETLVAQREGAGECTAIISALAAWLRHVRGAPAKVDDPRATELARLWRSEGEAGVARAVLGPGGLVGPGLTDAELRAVEARL